MQKNPMYLIAIIIGMITFSFVISNAFASEGGYYYPEFGSNSVPFSITLFFSALVIIGVCIFLIIRSRKSNPSRIKWFYLFISLSVLLIFGTIYPTGAFDPIEEYLMEFD